jgi:NAD(P)-dependent dehydrogenase (short-subunit alcohol dehydrogenase family)
MTEQVAIVTGGSGGIGLAICKHLLADGYTVVSLDRREPGVDHERLHSVRVDLSDSAATTRAAADVTARFPVDTVVHNAGVIRAALLSDVEMRDFEALARLHMGAAITLVQAALPRMRETGYGRIVLLSSRAIQGLQTRTSYSATKAGMIGLTRTWALELAPEGITVNAIAPGPIRTDQFHDVIPAGSAKEKEVAAGLPVRRLGEPEDVARAVAFLAAPESGFITGQTLYVCGGTSLGGLSL